MFGKEGAGHGRNPESLRITDPHQGTVSSSKLKVEDSVLLPVLRSCCLESILALAKGVVSSKEDHSVFPCMRVCLTDLKGKR